MKRSKSLIFFPLKGVWQVWLISQDKLQREPSRVGGGSSQWCMQTGSVITPPLLETWLITILVSLTSTLRQTMISLATRYVAPQGFSLQIFCPTRPRRLMDVEIRWDLVSCFNDGWLGRVPFVKFFVGVETTTSILCRTWPIINRCLQTGNLWPFLVVEIA